MFQTVNCNSCFLIFIFNTFNLIMLLLRNGAITVLCHVIFMWRDINDYKTGSVVSVIGHLILLMVTRIIL